jgi:hypothetical protein
VRKIIGDLEDVVESNRIITATLMRLKLGEELQINFGEQGSIAVKRIKL